MMNKLLLAVFALFICLSVQSPRPVVLWHGMGDSCCNPLSMGSVKRMIERDLPGVYVHSLKIGKNIEQDTLNGFFMNVNDQIVEMREIVKNDTQLANGFNAIGFSQGGQFLRAYAQRYSDGPRIHNLISLGGQHQGVFGFPRCPGDQKEYCEVVRRMLNIGAYEKQIQDTLVQAEYWQDPFQEEIYREKSVFLADINNEGPNKNATYKANLTKLNGLVLGLFGNDTMVQPKESEWFGFYKEGQDKEVVAMRDTPLYTEDWIGLKTLDGQKKIHFITSPGDHLQFTREWFTANVVPFLKD